LQSGLLQTNLWSTYTCSYNLLYIKHWLMRFSYQIFHACSNPRNYMRYYFRRITWLTNYQSEVPPEMWSYNFYIIRLYWTIFFLITTSNNLPNWTLINFHFLYSRRILFSIYDLIIHFRRDFRLVIGQPGNPSKVIPLALLCMLLHLMMHVHIALF
jgi:hypothetical protein